MRGEAYSGDGSGGEGRGGGGERERKGESVSTSEEERRRTGWEQESVARNNGKVKEVGREKGGETHLNCILVVVFQLVELLELEALSPSSLVQVHKHALLGFRLLVVDGDACEEDGEESAAETRRRKRMARVSPRASQRQRSWRKLPKNGERLD